MDKKSELLEIAARVVADEGPDALSIRRLAAEAGTSTMAVYTWFGGKPELMRSLYREGFARFGAVLRSALPTEDVIADVIALGRRYRQFALDNPHLYNIMFGRNRAYFEPSDDDLGEALETFQILVESLTRGVQAGRLGGDPQLNALQLWAAVHGAVSLELIDCTPPDEQNERVYEALLHTLMAGLGAGLPARRRRRIAG